MVTLSFVSLQIAANFYPSYFSSSSIPFSFSFAPLILRNPKPPCSLYSDTSSSSFLRNPSLTSEPTAQNGTGNDRHDEPKNPEPRVKMPTAPWMQGPILLPPGEVLDLTNPNRKKKTKSSEKLDRALTDKVPGRMGKKALKKITHRIERIPGTSDSEGESQGSYQVGNGHFIEQLETVAESKPGRRKLPWEQGERPVVFRRMKKLRMPTTAELELDADLLRRLRSEARTMRKWIKVNKAGVTDAVVDEVHSVWGDNELVMLKFRLPLCRNMDRAREIVELKTGGMVVWSKKDALVAYRGCNYHRSRHFQVTSSKISSNGQALNPEIYNNKSENDFGSFIKRVIAEDNSGEVDDYNINYGTLEGGETGQTPIDRSLYEREGDRLLDGLGPRFVDWWYPKPLPVDADLLPEVVPGFTPPFRLPPPKTAAKLKDDELTYLRKFARYLHTHFVLGRNSQLQGLAVAILKLWEKCIVAKIAVKWGVPNTNHKLMASELKCLTGGVLILCNKFYIILYRGKDFLSGSVESLVVQRDTELQQWQLYEESMRLKATENLNLTNEASAKTSDAGTLSEFENIEKLSGTPLDIDNKLEVQLLGEKQRLEKELRVQEHKLSILRLKIERSMKELSKLDSRWKPSGEELDRELMTEEERECLRKMAKRMHRVLVLGRRGVFDGVIEGMHQHWKHREIVKVITKQKAFSQVMFTARQLERESGGALVSIDNIKEGHAIILYRGKNYRRPIIVGKNLLTKRKALQRSLEMQRVGSLKFFAYQREKTISDIRIKLADLQRRIEDLDGRVYEKM